MKIAVNQKRDSNRSSNVHFPPTRIRSSTMKSLDMLDLHVWENEGGRESPVLSSTEAGVPEHYRPFNYF